MRSPTPVEDLYAWHAAALAGDQQPVFEDEPQCGWFKRRFRRDGAWVPVRIECWRLVVDGELASDEVMIATTGGPAAFAITRAPDDVSEIWLHVARHPITEDEYSALVQRAPMDWMAPIDASEPVRPA